MGGIGYILKVQVLRSLHPCQIASYYVLTMFYLCSLYKANSKKITGTLVEYQIYYYTPADISLHLLPREILPDSNKSWYSTGECAIIV